MNKHAFPALALAAVVPCAIAAMTAPAEILDALRPSADERLAFVMHAHGAQIYVCKARANDANAYGWAFVEPQATLIENGEKVGYHGAGPVWESASDGSSVKGAVRERQDGGAGNIPWLLLTATPSEHAGRFAGVTSIQRVATRGGVEPGAKCDASMAGREARVKYTADYYFYKRAQMLANSKPAAAY